jgi:hypothetical protein
MLDRNILDHWFGSRPAAGRKFARKAFCNIEQLEDRLVPAGLLSQLSHVTPLATLPVSVAPTVSVANAQVVPAVQITAPVKVTAPQSIQVVTDAAAAVKAAPVIAPTAPVTAVAHKLPTVADVIASNNTTPVASLNQQVLDFARGKLGQQVGDGQCQTLVNAALDAAGAQRPGQGQEIDHFGTVVDLNAVKAGDVLQFENVNFKHTNADGSWFTNNFPHHTAIVEAVSGSRLTLLHQNLNGDLRVQETTIDLNDRLSGGSITAFQPVARVAALAAAPASVAPAISKVNTQVAPVVKTTAPVQVTAPPSIRVVSAATAVAVKADASKVSAVTISAVPPAAVTRAPQPVTALTALNKSAAAATAVAKDTAVAPKANVGAAVKATTSAKTVIDAVKKVGPVAVGVPQVNGKSVGQSDPLGALNNPGGKAGDVLGGLGGFLPGNSFDPTDGIGPSDFGGGRHGGGPNPSGGLGGFLPGNSFDPSNGIDAKDFGHRGSPGGINEDGTGGPGAPDLGLGAQTGRDKEIGAILARGMKGYGTDDKGDGSYYGAIIGWIVGGPVGSIVGSAIGGAIGVGSTAANAGTKETDRATQVNKDADMVMPSTKPEGDDKPSEPQKDNNTPTPDDPKGGGGHNMPNPESTGGSGPRSNVGSNFMPNPEGTGGSGPRSNVTYVAAAHGGLAGHDFLPNPDGVGGGGPNSHVAAVARK